jgi:hypothetical protein
MTELLAHPRQDSTRPPISGNSWMRLESLDVTIQDFLD